LQNSLVEFPFSLIRRDWSNVIMCHYLLPEENFKPFSNYVCHLESVRTSLIQYVHDHFLVSASRLTPYIVMTQLTRAILHLIAGGKSFLRGFERSSKFGQIDLFLTPAAPIDGELLRKIRWQAARGKSSSKLALGKGCLLQWHLVWQGEML
jgi:hypothetical protein